MTILIVKASRLGQGVASSNTVLCGDRTWREVAGLGGGLISAPPQGSFKVTNIYVNSAGKLVIQYSDVPQS